MCVKRVEICIEHLQNSIPSIYSMNEFVFPFLLLRHSRISIGYMYVIGIGPEIVLTIQVIRNGKVKKKMTQLLRCAANSRKQRKIVIGTRVQCCIYLCIEQICIYICINCLFCMWSVCVCVCITSGVCKRVS